MTLPRLLAYKFLVAACSVLLLSPACAANLISNPGFEDFPAGLHQGEGELVSHGWRFFSVGGSGGTMEVVSPGFQGDKAIKLTRTSMAGDSGLDKALPSEVAPVTAGHRYRNSIWARSDDGATLQVALITVDQNAGWIGIAALKRFPLSTEWREYVVEAVAPPNVYGFVMDMRVMSPGSVFVDEARLLSLTSSLPLPQARITYPVNEPVDSLRPTIGFMGPGHTSYQVVLTQGEDVIWDSGEVASNAYSATCPVQLQPSSAYGVKVRLRNSSGWGEFSDVAAFATPAAPLLKMLSPAEADAVRGPKVTFRWRAEAPGGILSQTVSIDEGPPASPKPGSAAYTATGLGAGLHTAQITITSAEGSATETVRFHVRLTPTPAETIYYYDLSWIHTYNNADLDQARTKYDILMAVAALQGLVNRDGPRLYVRVFTSDTTWWNRLRENANWLSNMNVVTLPSGLENLEQLFQTFADAYQGVVLWDYNVFSTANVACTVAGADDLIPVRYDPSPGSLFDRFVQSGPKIPIRMSLVNKFTGAGTIWQTGLPSTGSAKNDAYVWARVKYLESGKSNPGLLFYGIDAYWTLTRYWNSPELGNTLPSRDYVVQHKGFVYDLSVWGDDVPLDDPGQPMGTDLATHKSILAAAAVRAPGMIHLIGFVPWWAKYSYESGDLSAPADGEFASTKLWTSYNAYMDGDAPHLVDMPNASILGQFPLPDRLTQNRKQSFEDHRKKGYVDAEFNVAPINFLAFYAGDYDSAAWLARIGPNAWAEARRGSIPVSWAFNPNLVERAAAVYEYFNRTRTDADSFVAGDSGAGYVNPTLLLGERESGLPSAHDLWIQHNLNYYRLTNIKITGFILNGPAGVITPEAEQMYAEFSPDGSFSQPAWWPQGEHLVGSMPALILDHDLSYSVTTAINTIFGLGYHSGTRFLSFRSIRQGPNNFYSIYTGLVGRNAQIPWTVVDMRSYADLNSTYIGRVPDNRATYTFDTIPFKVDAGSEAAVAVGIRNDGWLAWQSGHYALMVTWSKEGEVARTQTVALAGDVESSKGTVLQFVLEAPGEAGEYVLNYQVTRDGVPFTDLGDYRWEKKVKVRVAAPDHSIGSARLLPDGTEVMLPDVAVTTGASQLAGRFYVQDEDRTAGLRVDAAGFAGASIWESDRVILRGTMATVGPERVLVEPELVSVMSGEAVAPLYMLPGSVGGGPVSGGLPGFPMMIGLTNLGLLVATWGTVEDVDTASSSISLATGEGEGRRQTLLVEYAGVEFEPPAEGAFVLVIGISSFSEKGGVLQPVVLMRKAGDLQVLVQ